MRDLSKSWDASSGNSGVRMQVLGKVLVRETQPVGSCNACKEHDSVEVRLGQNTGNWPTIRKTGQDKTQMVRPDRCAVATKPLLNFVRRSAAVENR